jgi:hypothetical protein
MPRKRLAEAETCSQDLTATVQITASWRCETVDSPPETSWMQTFAQQDGSRENSIEVEFVEAW